MESVLEQGRDLLQRIHGGTTTATVHRLKNLDPIANIDNWKLNVWRQTKDWLLSIPQSSPKGTILNTDRSAALAKRLIPEMDRDAFIRAQIWS